MEHKQQASIAAKRMFFMTFACALCTVCVATGIGISLCFVFPVCFDVCASVLCFLSLCSHIHSLVPVVVVAIASCWETVLEMSKWHKVEEAHTTAKKATA